MYSVDYLINEKYYLLGYNVVSFAYFSNINKLQNHMYHSFSLKEIRKTFPNYLPKNPREHQLEAFSAFSKTFNFRDNSFQAGILNFPTGGGKTFTAVRWICTNVLSREEGVKVIWLAHTAHLLEQAYEEFQGNILEISPRREVINIRVVSSSPNHSKPDSIKPSDDVVIVTTQTAISNSNVEALDRKGKRITTAFEKFVQSATKSRLFIVLDEAHHAPAFGCRTLLMGNEQVKGIKDIVPNLYLLGLTATPTYSDERRRGWLWKIFNNKVIAEADKAKLTKQGILAVPNPIQRPTGRDIEVNDKTYNTIVREHKDLPEEIVDRLAKDSGRNDFIVNDYVLNKSLYGKTLIFADRSEQCIYLEKKLRQQNVNVASVFYHKQGSALSAEERNENTKNTNIEKINAFKRKNNPLEVLINVKMLTEGTDIPNIQTVFVTRQTTSSILLTQMIGRALRGKNAGGEKDVANLVFFTDNWKRFINFATLDGGGTEETSITVRGRYPIEFISIQLIEALAENINSGIIFSDKPFINLIPLGWYETEVTVAVEEETNTFKEFVIVYNGQKEKFDKFLAEIKLNQEWEKEKLSENWMMSFAKAWIKKYFDEGVDNQTKTLDLDLIKLARHKAQANSTPPFHFFIEREHHDLSKLAEKIVKMGLGPFQKDEFLSDEFNSRNKLWKSFYRDFQEFKRAYGYEEERVIYKLRYGSEPEAIKVDNDYKPRKRELTEEEKLQVMKRDNYTCLGCGKKKNKGHRVQFQIDHIGAFAYGEETTIDKSQTLCLNCHKQKGLNAIDFRINETPLVSPKDSLRLNNLFFSDSETTTPSYIISRIINNFYHCRAVAQIKTSKRPTLNGKICWEVELFKNNNPVWLKKHKKELLKFVKLNLFGKLGDLIIL